MISMSSAARLAAASALSAALVLSPAVRFGSPAAAADTAQPAEAEAPLLRRLTESQYRATIADIFGPDIRITGRIEPDLRVDGLLAAGTGAVSVTPGGAEQYAAIARGVAQQVVDPEHRERLVGCQPDAADPQGEACATQFFDRIGRRLYRRPLDQAERDFAVASTLAAAERLGDFHAGLATSLAGMMIDLPFLFQIDVLVRDPAGGGLTLDGWSRASRLSYLLWNTTPDDELLRAAEQGELMTRAGLERQVDRMIASPRFEEGARAFFDDYFRLDASSKLVKDPVIYPAFRPSVASAAREQALRTTIELLVRDKADYRELFTSRRVAMNRVLSPLYRIPHATKDWSMVELPDDQGRAGLLTQIAFLSLHSHEGRTSPTLRGLAIREMFLCEHVAPPPANVNFTIVQDTGNPEFKTTRDRLKAHLDDEDCASCHRKTDTMGLTFEKFDGAGQFRMTEAGNPIDTSGALDSIPVLDPVSLGETLSRSPKVTQCLTQSAWKAASGRALTGVDVPLTEALHGQFAASGYRFAALMRAIAISPALYAGPRNRKAMRIADATPSPKRSF